MTKFYNKLYILFDEKQRIGTYIDDVIPNAIANSSDEYYYHEVEYNQSRDIVSIDGETVDDYINNLLSRSEPFSDESAPDLSHTPEFKQMKVWLLDELKYTTLLVDKSDWD